MQLWCMCVLKQMGLTIAMWTFFFKINIRNFIFFFILNIHITSYYFMHIFFLGGIAAYVSKISFVLRNGFFFFRSGQ